MVQSLGDYVIEVAALGAVAVIVLPAIIHGAHSSLEQVFTLLYLVTNLGYISKSERCAILINEILQ